jgi:YidC/Oxa1 family membrane protein insertase
MLLAFVLMGAILFLTPYFYKTVVPPPPAKQTPASAKQAPEKAVPPPAAAAVKEPAARKKPARPGKKQPAPPVQISAQKEETFLVDTSLYRIVLSNRGAVVRSWVLKKYKDSAGKPLDLVNAVGAGKAGFPLAFEFKDKKPPVDLNQALYAAKPLPDGLGIQYEYADENTVARKSLRFHKDRYLAEFSSEVTLEGAGLPHLVAWRGGFGDPAVPNPAASGRTLCYDLPAAKLITKEAKAARDGPVTESGVYSFAGLEDNYFTAVFLPANNSQIDFRTLSDTVASSLNPKEEARVGAAVGGAARSEFALFVGPKDVDVLRKVDPKLEQVVDWGWFGFIAKPLFLILNWINDAAVHNYGWSIIFVTVIINFALLPLKLTSMKSMKKMQALQPQIAAINAKYKNIGLRDPRKAEQNQEVMELYKKHGVNPMGGCIPMVIQIPFFFAFYKVLMVAIEMRGANWLWVTDLSQPEHLPIRILPVAMVISQFVMQKMTPATSADPTQQKMMLFMPLVFGFMFYQFQSGLVLYWLTSNLVGIGQQWLINKTTPPVVMAPEPGKKKKTSGGGR